MNELQIFESAEFGSVRSIIKNDEVWFVGKDVAEILGYGNTRDALSRHVDFEDKNTVVNPDGNKGNPNMVIINESGLYSLVLSSKLPTAKKFKHWVTSEVLPAIRKTGSYSKHKEATVREQAMLNNSLCRKASLLLRCSKETALPLWKELLVRGAANLVAGEELLPPPKTEKLYSATEIAKRNNVSSNKVGRIANLLGLKTDEYGCYCHDIARNCDKEVEVFMYNQKALTVIEDYLRGKGGVA